MAELIHRYLADRAQAGPDRPYVTDGDVTRSYGWMEERSSQLAQVLVAAGCRRGDRIALVLPKSADMIVAMHAALKADCAYVPIDVSSPAARIARVVDAAEPRVAIATSQTRRVLDAVVELGVGTEMATGSLTERADTATDGGDAWAFGADDVDAAAATPPATHSGPDDIAHVLFTSGSTGQPKGVPILNRNVTTFVEWASDHFAMRSEDRVSGHSPFHFDLSTFDIYGAAAAGAHLFLVPSQLALAPGRLASFIRDTRLTQWFSVPSAMTLLAKFDAIPKGSLPDLRRIIWCGEVLPTSTLRYWMTAVPDASFTNLYGPTEATIASSYFVVETRPESDLDEIPIGVACAGERLLVLDEALAPTPAGEIGELYIGGVGLAPGYWRDEETSARAFLADPRAPGERLYRTGDLGRVDEGGLTWFVGRKDTQIKSRGYRIELGEIETALSAIPILADSCVVGVATGGFEGTTICCAYATRNGEDVSPATIRAALASDLPGYMLPSRWLSLPELPKNANGKIDRPRVRTLFEDAAGKDGAR